MLFDSWAKKLKDETKEKEKEEIVFKPYDETIKTTPAPTPEPAQEETSHTEVIDASGNIELKVVRPERFDEVSTVADHLLGGRTVVLNIELLDKTTSRRMLDFLNGVTYSTDGDIKQVAQATYILTPHNVDVSDNK